MNLWSAEHGQSAEAIVHNHSYNKIRVAESFNEALPNLVKTDYFTDTFEAAKWLNSLGFIIPNSLCDSNIHQTYAEHGGFAIEIEPYGLYCKYFGSWNNETTMAFSLALQRIIIENFSDKNWAVICDMKDWELAIPETRDAFESLLYWAENHGLLAVANITTGLFDNLIKDFNQKLYEECHSKVEERYFSTVNEGIEWISLKKFYLNETK